MRLVAVLLFLAFISGLSTPGYATWLAPPQTNPLQAVANCALSVPAVWGWENPDTVSLRLRQMTPRHKPSTNVGSLRISEFLVGVVQNIIRMHLALATGSFPINLSGGAGKPKSLIDNSGLSEQYRAWLESSEGSENRSMMNALTKKGLHIRIISGPFLNVHLGEDEKLIEVPMDLWSNATFNKDLKRALLILTRHFIDSNTPITQSVDYKAAHNPEETRVRIEELFRKNQSFFAQLDEITHTINERNILGLHWQVLDGHGLESVIRVWLKRRSEIAWFRAQWQPDEKHFVFSAMDKAIQGETAEQMSKRTETRLKDHESAIRFITRFINQHAPQRTGELPSLFSDLPYDWIPVLGSHLLDLRKFTVEADIQASINAVASTNAGIGGLLRILYEANIQSIDGAVPEDAELVRFFSEQMADYWFDRRFSWTDDMANARGHVSIPLEIQSLPLLDLVAGENVIYRFQNDLRDGPAIYVDRAYDVCVFLRRFAQRLGISSLALARQSDARNFEETFLEPKYRIIRMTNIIKYIGGLKEDLIRLSLEKIAPGGLLWVSHRIESHYRWVGPKIFFQKSPLYENLMSTARSLGFFTASSETVGPDSENFFYFHILLRKPPELSFILAAS